MTEPNCVPVNDLIAGGIFAFLWLAFIWAANGHRKLLRKRRGLDDD